MQCGHHPIAIKEDHISFGLAIKRVKSLASIIHDRTELRSSEMVIPTVCGKRVHTSIFDSNDDQVEDLIVKKCTDGSNLNRTITVSARSSLSYLSS